MMGFFKDMSLYVFALGSHYETTFLIFLPLPRSLVAAQETRRDSQSIRAGPTSDAGEAKLIPISPPS